MEEIRYELKTSKQLSENDIEDFLKVFNDVFGANHNREWFNWKYRDNIYGESYIVIAYSGDAPVAVRSLWRNDIDSVLAYQPCDTAVISEYRNRGIFSEMTLRALEETGNDMIYNYPNENSYPGYIKLGWEVRNYFYLELVINKNNLKEETHLIPEDYLKWKFIDSPISKYYYYKKNNEYYLLLKRTGKIYYLLGRFDPIYKDQFEEIKYPVLFNYTKDKTLMYKLLKNRARIVSYDKNNKFKKLDIPIYKGDFF